MDRIDDATGSLLVRDLDGHEHELRELWCDRTAVLVFVRHFG